MPLPIDTLLKFTQLDPQDPSLFFALGQAYLEAGRFGEATAALERAIALKPLYTAAYWPLGKAWEGQGRLADAMAAYERGLAVGEMTHDEIPIKKMRARLNRRQKRASQSPENG